MNKEILAECHLTAQYAFVLNFNLNYRHDIKISSKSGIHLQLHVELKNDVVMKRNRTVVF